MRHDRFESFLWSQVLLVALLGATLALFLRFPSLRTPYAQPELRLVLATVFMLSSGLIALLCATRFGVDGRRFDLMLCGGFFAMSLSWLAFTVVPGIAGGDAHIASAAGQTVGWAAIAVAPFATGRVPRRRAPLWWLLAGAVALLPPIWLVSTHTSSLTGVLALQALVQLLAAITFGDRYRRRGEDLDQWLSIVATLSLFATLSLVFTHDARPALVARGDFLVLFAHAVLLVGLWRAIRASEFGRAVAEERARVAREIHDGLAQYLFSVATHASMIEAGAPLDDALPKLRDAVTAAQQEARYAILALSSAAGRAPFDSALRRYVDVLTADGLLEVELEIDHSIEVFRIVQEGLANARRHSDARHAWVQIGARAGERFVRVRDDGEGFAPEASEAGQGLRNIRERVGSIGGALQLSSAPGHGTSLEIVLR